jgi:sec-independent protein translocase protein TatA
MLNIGPQELLLILVIALIVVGPQRLPELGRTIGRGLREIRKAQDEVKRTIEVNLDDQPAATPPRNRPSASAAGAAIASAEEAIGGSGEGGAVSDPAPLASEPLPASEVREISRTLGHGLAELRRARDEIKRSFRVDMSEPPSPTGTAAPATGDAEAPGADDEPPQE